MARTAIKDRILRDGEYLGRCNIKGRLYSLEVKENTYVIYAVKNGAVSELLRYERR